LQNGLDLEAEREKTNLLRAIKKDMEADGNEEGVKAVSAKIAKLIKLIVC
jgi:hypothetical protein